MPQDSTLLVLAQSLEQPRVVKRIIEKAKDYDKIEVFGFKREIHEVNNFGILENYENVKLNIVGTMANYKYMKRLANYFRLIIAIYSKYGFKSKNLYVFGLDIRMVSTLVANSKIDYEISDIMWLYKSPLQKSFLRRIDTNLAKWSNSVIFTSKGFYDSHYKMFVKPENAIIKENKFKTYDKVSPILDIKKDKIRIAYIGAFRYSTIIERLLQVVRENKNLVLNFYGDGFKTIVEEMKKNASENENIFFHGAFKNPDDLENIYAENNVNFVVYKNTLENEKVAMPNKFYESGFFNIPIVAAVNTYVGQRVLDQNMGWTIDIDYNSISKFLNNLQMDNIIKHHENIKRLDKSLFESK
ncbi:glycosyltransferase family 4 protein [Maribacter algarum]|uniref:Glycosyltransferase family 4 protein n=1 Tax=Maribacter algarum (ex Zhang et al. 2020) TaxID=2578118 RepID=A0A5S3PHN8_9FLAO|nr:glycosyltransferase family 4 protein [Maribacter algarum]TMM53795.1 glycosyltransferase family 4 protein [Maribacter algarum]